MREVSTAVEQAILRYAYSKSQPMAHVTRLSRQSHTQKDSSACTGADQDTESGRRYLRILVHVLNDKSMLTFCGL